MPSVPSRSDDERLFLPYARVVSELETATSVFASGTSEALRHADQLIERWKEEDAPSFQATKRGTDSKALSIAIEEGRSYALLDANQRVIFARHQAENGVPYLYGMASIRLWGIVEAMVEDVSAILIATRAKCREGKTLQKLEIPYGQFLAGTELDRAHLVLELLQKTARPSLNPGVGRFEEILDELGMGGPVHPIVRKAILEMAELRNVLVHRAGKADRRLCDRCPWLRYAPGDPVAVRRGNFDAYAVATHWYILELERRLDILDGHQAAERLDRRQDIALAFLNVSMSK